MVTAPAAVATAALVAGAGGEAVTVALDPLAVVRDARTDLGFAPLAGAGLVAWTPVWLLAALGLRAAGVPAAVAALLRGGTARRGLAVLALAGWPLGLLLRISPVEAGQRVRPFNEALYFFEQSGLVLWVFAALALGGLRLRGLRAALALAAGLLLALPTTVQFAAQKRRTPSLYLDADAVAAAGALERASRPGDVVLQRPDLQRFPPAPMVLAGRRVPYTRFIPFFSQILPRAERRARFARTLAFFRTGDPARAREIAAGLGAEYVFLYGRRELRFDPEGILEPVYESERARVYRILR